jgi:hypothetical protein
MLNTCGIPQRFSWLKVDFPAPVVGLLTKLNVIKCEQKMATIMPMHGQSSAGTKLDSEGLDISPL